MKVTVLIPVFNEINTIQEIIRRVLKTNLVDEIILVDDGSTDGTRQQVQSLDGTNGIRVILHEENKGKGSAVNTGMENVTGDIIIQDADLEYDPRDYAVLLKPFEERIADVVYGSRFLGAARRPILFWNMVANKMITFLANILYNNILSDIETGYKVFRPEIQDGITLNARGFEFDPEFTAKILKKNVRIYEVPITFNPRDYSEGKKIRLSDAFIAVWTLLRYRLSKLSQ